ncbi:MAG TPA: AmmeMemoRadiSam system radical SAM enzyme [Archaeoglobaceae archaeon]|nr:AmmeMemoRadiSam system radical SAM enzyme [Archaeoglobaceae archaeon]
MIVESYLYKKLNDVLMCKTCNHYCKIKPEKWGRCRVRKNEDGVLNVYNYGMASSIAVDPIEKKPIHNFKPGSRVLSFGTVSCNFRCLHCQNYEIAFADLTYPYLRELKPEDVLKMTEEKRADGIAWTYNEPGIWHEFALDSSKIVKEKGYYIVYVTNGYLSKESIDQHVLDAANVDIKAFNERFYKKICKADLEKVLETTEYLYRKNIHLEVTYLIIPRENDSSEEIKSFSEWVYGIDKSIPVHFSRFHPDYQMLDKPPTPIETLEKAAEIAQDTGIEYVYLGNVWKHRFESTYCPNCGHLIIERDGFYVGKIDIDENKCPECGYRLSIII